MLENMLPVAVASSSKVCFTGSTRNDTDGTARCSAVLTAAVSGAPDSTPPRFDTSTE